MELGGNVSQERYPTICRDLAFAWNLKGRYPAGQHPDAPIVEKDITERGDDY